MNLPYKRTQRHEAPAGIAKEDKKALVESVPLEAPKVLGRNSETTVVLDSFRGRDPLRTRQTNDVAPYPQ